MQKQIMITLLMLSLAACKPEINTGITRPSDDRFICQPLPEKPDIKPLQAFQSDNGALVYSKSDVDQRDANIANFIVSLRGAWFDCSNQVQWHDDYWDGFASAIGD